MRARPGDRGRRTARRQTSGVTPPGSLARRALELIAARACEPGIRLAQVAHALSRSESRLSHVLRRETGRTFWEHVHEVRLARAKAELLDASRTIKEIAARVGYDTAQLDRRFKRLAGVTPAAWRAQHFPASGGDAARRDNE